MLAGKRPAPQGPQARKHDCAPAATRPSARMNEESARLNRRALPKDQNNFRRSIPRYSPNGSITKG